MSDYKSAIDEFAAGKPYSPAIPLSSHQFFAFLTLTVATIFIFLNLLLPKKSSANGKSTSSVLTTIQYVVYSLIASSAFGVGVIFLSNSVGVYA